MTANQLLPALMTLSLLTGACAQGGAIEGEGEVILENPGDEGKGDTVFGKTLRYLVRGEWPWNPDDLGRAEYDTEVISQTDSTVRVRALRIHFNLPEDNAMELSVDAERFNDLGEVSTDMAFLLMAPAGDFEWDVVRCDDRSYFKSVVLDAKHRELDATARTEDGEVLKTYSFEECGIPVGTDEVGLFPFPSSNWGNMQGYYRVGIDADCGTRICDGQL